MKLLPASLTANPILSRWIGFEGDGSVRLSTGKVELGQGILSTLAQIAADELDIAPERFRFVSGDTVRSPSEGFTSGSNSTDVTGSSVRLVCAEIRGLYLQHLATTLGCAAEHIGIDDGRFLRGNALTGEDYWSLAGQVDLDRPYAGNFAAKDPARYRHVGRPSPRLDLALRMTAGAFIHDLAPAGMLHARVLHRPWQDANLISLDTDAIAAAFGVHAFRDGSFVAFAAADEFAAVQALDKARAAAVWDGGRPAPDAIGDAAWLREQPARTFLAEAGAPGTEHTGDCVSARYSRPFLTHGSIAPSCALAEFRDGVLTVHSHSQGVFTLREQLAGAFGLAVADVHVMHHVSAGCYGHNSADDVAFDAAFVAMRLPGRPVRALWTREDEFSAAPMGPAMAVEIRAELQDDRPVDWTIEIWSPTHAQRPGMNGLVNLLGAQALADAPPLPAHLDDIPDAIGGGALRNAVALYGLPHQHIIHHLLDRIPARSSTMRALGSHPNNFAIESFLDELAERAGEDPVAYRLALSDDPRAAAVIAHAAKMSGWTAGEPTGEGSARGIGFGRYKNKAAYVAMVVEVEAIEDIRLVRAWCAVDAGLVVNPDNAASQIEGGFVQGASWTLKEQIRFADGIVSSRSWEDYPILRFSEIPEIEIEFIGDPANPSLGIGEASIGPAAAAIGNAVARALGIRIRDLPITRERLLEAMLA